ncbi:MAG: histidine kinase, partial [Bacteroidetes bacterium]|nr:histidine kinase [Bacteroidota bacterium]
LKHAKPSTLILEFYGYPNSFVFQYTDNGKGFDTKHTPKGFGFITIESRTLGMNGSFEINSVSNEGSIIQIEIPR